MSVRLVYAGLFILIGVLGELVFIDRRYPNINPLEWKIFGPWMVFLLLAANFLFSERSPWVKRDGKLVYRRRDELVSESHRAHRALELRGRNYDDVWYMLELDDGRVICLWDNLPTGPLGFDRAHPETRRFPCTEFTILRHADERFTVEVTCAGQAIKPTTISLPIEAEDWGFTFLPQDGEVIPDRTFDEVKAEALKVTRGFSNDETI